MVEWQVFLAIVAIVGFIITVAKCAKYFVENITNLVKSNENLTDAIKNVSDDLKEALDHNKESHKKIWEHNDKQDIILNDYEVRISIIEEKMKHS